MMSQGPGHARLLRVPQPGRPLLREDDDRDLREGARDRSWDILGRGRQAGHPARRAADLPAAAGQRPDGDRLPHPVDRQSATPIPPALQGRDRASVVGDYKFDVSDFRTDDRERDPRDIHAMTDKRFALARHLRDDRPWDFFMMVEMGTDRVHHAFWQYMDPDHHRYVPGNPFESVIARLLQHVDSKIGELLERPPATTPRHGRLRPRRPVHGRRHRDQRVADAEGLPRPAGARRPADPGSRRCKVDWPRTTRGAAAATTAGSS